MTAEAAKTFSIVGCTIFFVVPLSGFAEGSAIEIEPIGDTFTMVEGVDGSFVMGFTGSEACKFKVRLLQTSNSNAILSSAREADLQLLKRGGGGIVLPFLFKDNNGLDAFYAPKARIIKPPKMTRGAKVEMTEWEFASGECKIFHGGTPG